MYNTRILATLAILATVVIAQAQDSFLTRTQFTPGGAPYDTVAVLTPSIEVWSYGFNTKSPDLEIGRLYSVTKSGKKSKGFLLAGGYAAIWPATQNTFAIPFALFSYDLGNIRVKGGIGEYLPIGTFGPSIFCSDQIAITAPIKNGIRYGLATSIWAPQGAESDLKIGLIATDPFKGSSLTTRCLFNREGHAYVRTEIGWKL